MLALFSVTLSGFFFFNDTATTEIYTLSLHDALPIWRSRQRRQPALHADRHRQPADSSGRDGAARPLGQARHDRRRLDRKSTRLNSSHSQISYAVISLKKKNITNRVIVQPASVTNAID